LELGIKADSGCCLVHLVNVVLRIVLRILSLFGLKILLGTLRQHQPLRLRLERLPPTNPPDKYLQISIVTPSFNQVQFVGHTLQSVLDQQYPNLEYIVIDGASNDGSQQVIAQVEEHLTHWISESDKGQTEAINKGFRLTTGEIMGYLNSDDLLLPGALNTVADYFARRPDIDVIYGHRILIDEHGMAIGRWILPPHTSLAYAWADFVPQETMFWRRSIWDQAGGYLDESFRFAMDWDLISRFSSIGARFYRLPRYLAAFRVHAKQKTSLQMATDGAEESERVIEKMHGRKVGHLERRLRVMPYLLMHMLQDAQNRKAYVNLIN
jgi:glycosyltransferase involved in cell wall biosynthesis